MPFYNVNVGISGEIFRMSVWAMNEEDAMRRGLEKGNKIASRRSQKDYWRGYADGKEATLCFCNDFLKEVER